MQERRARAGGFSLPLSPRRAPSDLYCALLSKVSSSISPLLSPAAHDACPPPSSMLFLPRPAPSCPFTSLSAPSSVDGIRRRWLGGWAEAARDPDLWAWKATIVASTETGGGSPDNTTLPSDWFLGKARSRPPAAPAPASGSPLHAIK